MDFSRLKKYLDFIPVQGYQGVSMVVAKDGEIVFSHGAGFRDQDKKVPSSVDDLYWIFSASKPLTCTAAMTLVEQGKLDIHDPVSKYLPEYADVKVLENGVLRPANTVMTIEHLFTMTGGLTYNLQTENILNVLKANPEANTREIVAAFAKDPLLFDPGTKYNYSLCHDVLGAVIEVITGEKLGDYMDRVMFKPLEMNRTTFRPNEKELAPLFQYEQKDSVPVYREKQNNEYCINHTYESGGAGIASCATDYIKLLSALSMGGTAKNGYQLLKPETVQSMGVSHLSDGARRSFYTSRLFGYSWGLCGRCHERPELSLSPSAVGEFGWDGAANVFGLCDPTNHVAFFFSTGLRGFEFGYHLVHPMLRELAYESMGIYSPYKV